MISIRIATTVTETPTGDPTVVISASQSVVGGFDVNDSASLYISGVGLDGPMIVFVGCMITCSSGMGCSLLKVLFHSSFLSEGNGCARGILTWIVSAVSVQLLFLPLAILINGVCRWHLFQLRVDGVFVAESPIACS